MGTKVDGNTAHAPRCVIVGAGDVADYEALGALVRTQEQFVICADGGYHHCAGLGIVPDLLVGDFDSLQEIPQDVPRVTLPAEKDYTDTTLAVEEALERGHRNLLLCGMLGGRLDHTLANLQTLGWLAGRGVQAHITDGVTFIHPLAAGDEGCAVLELAPRERYYFSLLSLVNRCCGVSIRGARYLLEDYPLSSLEPPRAVSNEYCGTPVQITLHKGVLLVVETPMD